MCINGNYCFSQQLATGRSFAISLVMAYTDGARITNLYLGPLEKPFEEKPSMRSAYLKTPRDKVVVGVNGFEGDEHGSIHGGPERAVNHFPVEDYEELKKSFPHCSETLRAGELNGFGENISTEGGNMNFHTVCVGDRFSVGTCILEVAHPRYPCKKVNFRHSTEPETLNQFVLQNGISGWFYRVIQTGEIKVGDTFKRIAHPHPEWTLHKLQTGLFGDAEHKETSKEFYQAVLELELLSPFPWKNQAQKVLDELQNN